MILFNHFVHTRLVYRFQYYRCFDRTGMFVCRVLDDAILRNEYLTVHLETQLTDLIALDREEIQRVDRRCYSGQLQL